MSDGITYKVKKNVRGDGSTDYRVHQYIDGEWENDFDDEINGGWSKRQAAKVMDYLIKSNHCTFYTL